MLVAELNRSLLFSKNVADWIQEEKAIVSARNRQNVLVGNICDGLTMPLGWCYFPTDSSILFTGFIIIFSVSDRSKKYFYLLILQLSISDKTQIPHTLMQFTMVRQYSLWQFYQECVFFIIFSMDITMGWRFVLLSVVLSTKRYFYLISESMSFTWHRLFMQALRLSHKALNETAPGKIVNLLSNDVNRFDAILNVLHPLWASPLMTIVASYILWVETRWAGMIGLFVVLLIVPIQSELQFLLFEFQ